jgi:hypothetical protein
MIETLNIFWSSPIELRVIILAVLIAFPLLAYFGIKGTNEVIEEQNKQARLDIAFKIAKQTENKKTREVK